MFLIFLFRIARDGKPEKNKMEKALKRFTYSRDVSKTLSYI